MAQPGDVILVAGKGHEDYQIIRGVKHHFDDHEVIREAFGLSLGCTAEERRLLHRHDEAKKPHFIGQKGMMLRKVKGFAHNG
jgi:hypothetical protein